MALSPQPESCWLLRCCFLLPCTLGPCRPVPQRRACPPMAGLSPDGLARPAPQGRGCKALNSVTPLRPPWPHSPSWHSDWGLLGAGCLGGDVSWTHSCHPLGHEERSRCSERCWVGRCTGCWGQADRTRAWPPAPLPCRASRRETLPQATVTAAGPIQAVSPLLQSGPQTTDGSPRLSPGRMPTHPHAPTRPLGWEPGIPLLRPSSASAWETPGAWTVPRLLSRLSHF